MDLDNDQGMFKAGTDVYMILGQMTSSNISRLMMASLQIQNKFSYLIFITLLSHVALVRNLYTVDELKENIIFVATFPAIESIFEIVFLWFFSDMAGEIFTEIYNKAEKAREVEVILGQLEEGILIFHQEDNSVHYFNKLFLNFF